MGFKKKREKRPEIPDAHVQFLLDGNDRAEEAFFFSCDDAAVRAAWKIVKDDLLLDWIREHPGTRPFGWWEYDAPRWTRKFGAFWDGTLPEPRLRIGGKGTPNFEALNYVPAFDRGIPRSWVSDFDVSYYNGRAVDVHGNRIGAEYAEGHFPHDAIDPEDPPVFESEASYLDRHGLLSAAERKRLTDADFEPEVMR